QRLLERAARIVGPVVAVVELAGQEQVRAADPGGGDPGAHLRLVAVHLGGVDVPVTGLEGGAYGGGGVGGRHLERVVAELGDGVARVQRDRGDGGAVSGIRHGLDGAARAAGTPRFRRTRLVGSAVSRLVGSAVSRLVGGALRP